jgi:hypothetical protein
MSHFRSRIELDRWRGRSTTVHVTPFVFLLLGLASMSVGAVLALSF